jgi:hypothetical protein
MRNMHELEEMIHGIRATCWRTSRNLLRAVWRLLGFTHEKSESLRWRLGLLKDIQALEAERVLVAKSESFYADEASRLCVQIGHEIAREDVSAAEATKTQFQCCLRRSASENARLKQLLYETNHKHNLLHRHRAVRLRKEQPDADN